MTPNPAICSPSTSLQDAARIMADNDCGSLPVVDTSDSNRPLGIITDRDIVTRVIALGQNPLEMRVADAMTDSVISLRPDDSLDKCRHLMEEHRVRRILVVDNGQCVGIVAQADLALNEPRELTAELVAEISRHNGSTARFKQK